MAYESKRLGYAGTYQFAGWDVRATIEADYASQSSIGRYRQEGRWTDVETLVSGSPVYDWTKIRNPLNRAIGFGIPASEVYVQLTTTPPHRRAQGTGTYAYSTVADYANFIKLLYANVLEPLGIHTIEGQNEPNVFKGTALLLPRQQRWADMMVEGARALRAEAFRLGGNSARDACIWISGGLANQNAANGDVGDWLAAAVAHNPDFLDEIDEFGYHPYDFTSRKGGPPVAGQQFPDFTVLNPDRASGNLVAKTRAISAQMATLGGPVKPITNTESGLEHHPWAITGHGLAMTTKIISDGSEQYDIAIHNPRNTLGNLITLPSHDERLPNRVNSLGVNRRCVWFRGVASEAEAAWILDRVTCWWFNLEMPTTAAPVNQAGRTPAMYPRAQVVHDSTPRGPWDFYRHIDYEVTSLDPISEPKPFRTINPWKGTYMTPASTGEITVPTLKRNPDGGDDVLAWIKRVIVPNVAAPPPPPETRRIIITLAGSGTGRVFSDVHGGDLIDTALADMEIEVPTGTVVRVEADPDDPDTFAGYSGAVVSANPVINVTVDAQKAITASFTDVAAATRHMSVGVDPSSPEVGGQIVSTPPGIDTDGPPPDNAHDWPNGQVVILEARAKPGFLFSRYTGTEPDAGPSGPVRQWTMNAGALVRAEFIRPTPPTGRIATVPLLLGWGRAADAPVKPYGPTKLLGPAAAPGAPRSSERVVNFPVGECWWIWDEFDLPDDYRTDGPVSLLFDLSSAATTGQQEWRGGVAFFPPGVNRQTFVTPEGITSGLVAPPFSIGATVSVSIAVVVPAGTLAGSAVMPWIGRVPSSPSSAIWRLHRARLVYEQPST